MALAKVRHIAFRARDPEEMTKFFVEALGMELTQQRSTGVIDLSDGTLNITILPISRPGAGGQAPKEGIDHIGFTVEDDDEAKQRLLALGARELDRINFGDAVRFEMKFEGPGGIVVDIGHWVGTAPIDAAAEEPAGAAR